VALTFGLVFGWYFSSTRMLLSLVCLAFADQALVRWPPEDNAGSVSETVFAASAFLLPLNFLTLAVVKETRMSLVRALRVLPFLLQVFAVWWLCDPMHQDIAVALRSAYLPGWSTHWTPVPQAALIVFLIAGLLLSVRCLVRRNSMDAGAAWALGAVFLAYHGTRFGWSPANFFSAAGVILFAALLQETYQDTYRDELTGIAGRMAYAEATAQLASQYALAVLAIDQLNGYACIHGKPVVEQILKLLAPKVQTACRTGRVFRVSGEELTLLFQQQSAVQALVELERIRKRLESTLLILRDGRRIREEDPEVRGTATARGNDQVLPITASIGVADSLVEGATLSVVIKAAYRALYEAKGTGGNAVKRGAVAARASGQPYRHSAAAAGGGEY
jgi:GGDEF domain-containing protein